MKINVLNIIKQTGADGPGLRNSLYVAGCTHNCPGCHNQDSHDFNAGVPMEIDDIVNELIDPYSDITISGGDPLHPNNVLKIIELLKIIRKIDPTKNIWLYTGYTYEYLRNHQDLYQLVFNLIDTMVDGPYIESKRDITGFCGSTNQRFIYFELGKVTKVTNYKGEDLPIPV